MAEILVRLPESLRDELKDPFGPVFTDAGALLAAAGEPLVTVGDVVTYHVIEAGVTPDLSIIDERTERQAVDSAIAKRLDAFDGFDRRVTVDNPPAALTDGLVREIRDGLARTGSASTVIHVDGEEDLATLPVIVGASTEASVVYGQPGEGMVLVTVEQDTRDTVSELLRRLDGDPERLISLLENE